MKSQQNIIEFVTRPDLAFAFPQHWDTRPDTAGFNDNGAGVAAVLEVARMMTSSNERCNFPSKDGAARRPEHTVMFALFDLEEYGGQGSKEFVERILIKSIMDRWVVAISNDGTCVSHFFIFVPQTFVETPEVALPTMNS